MHSEQINELAGALSKAQGQMRAAAKDSVNPHLRNTYASLSSIIEAAKEPLSANALAFSQILSQVEGGLILETILMHTSGQWLQSEVLIDATATNKGVNQAQALGSALTYYKRYALAAMLGVSVAEEDDDGNAAQSQVKRQRPVTGQPRVNPETGEVTEGAQSQAGQPPKTNGHTHPQTSNKPAVPNPVDAFFAQVQQATGNYYRHKEHLYNTLRGWPKFTDPDDVASKLSIAVDHANEKQQGEAVVEEEIAF